MNCEVLLVNPPLLERFNGAPMNLVILGTYLQSKGFQVRLLDLCGCTSPREALLSAVEQYQPLLVALGSYSPSHLITLKLAQAIKERFPSMPVAKGGIHETFVPGITLERHPYVDYVIRGDGEKPLAELLQYLRGESPLESIMGLSYRSHAGRLIQNLPEVPRGGATLDTFPIPDRTLLQDTAYYNFPIFGGKRTAQLISTRGCPFKCSFCLASSYSDQTKGTTRWRTLQNVHRELELLKRSGYEAVFFDDSVFTVNPQRVKSLCECLATLGFEWGCQTRVDRVTPPLLATMRAAGCSYIFYGVEAGDDHQLEVMHKDIVADQSWQAIQQTCAVGIRVGVSVILGYPGETDAQVLATFQRLATFNAKMVRVSLGMFALYPGTQDWDRALAEGIITPDAYERPHATEAIWTAFDEGAGAIHLVNTERATSLLKLATDVLGSRLLIDLPKPSFAF